MTKNTLSPNFDQLLQEYKTDYMAARNLAPKTRIEYETDITQFLTFLESSHVHEIDQLEPKHIRAFLAELDQLGLAGSSRRRKLSVVRSFCKWLKNAGYVANNPSLQVEAPRSGDKEPRVLTKEEYQRVVSRGAKTPRSGADPVDLTNWNPTLRGLSVESCRFEATQTGQKGFFWRNADIG